MSLKHIEGRVVLSVDPEQKNYWTFSSGETIRLERNFDNFDKKYTSQVLGVCISAEDIPQDAFVLFHHNGLHETYQILNHGKLSGKDIAAGIKLISIPERDCFFWKLKDEEKWHPTKNYATALRVYEPYNGLLEGVEPTLIKNTLYVTSGKYEGQVVKTLKACDYQITFRNENGIDENIIRFRPDGDEDREEEAIAIMHELTEKVKDGKLIAKL